MGLSLNEFLHWTIIARSVGEHSEIVLIPGHRIVPSSDSPGTSFCFRAIVKTPKHCKVKNIAFYGDNGLNSLCPSSDIETPVNERRQAIGYIITYHDPSCSDTRSELWLFRYDELTFQRVEFKSVGDKLIVPDASPLEVKDALIVATEDLDNVLVPKRRLISTCAEDEMQMSLCG